MWAYRVGRKGEMREGERWLVPLDRQGAAGESAGEQEEKRPGKCVARMHRYAFLTAEPGFERLDIADVLHGVLKPAQALQGSRSLVIGRGGQTLVPVVVRQEP